MKTTSCWRLCGSIDNVAFIKDMRKRLAMIVRIASLFRKLCRGFILVGCGG